MKLKKAGKIMLCPFSITMQSATGFIPDKEKFQQELIRASECRKSGCAWWDEELNQCCIKSISSRLTNINRGMAK